MVDQQSQQSSNLTYSNPNYINSQSHFYMPNNSYNIASQFYNTTQYNPYNSTFQYNYPYNPSYLPTSELSYHSIAEFLEILSENFLEYKSKLIDNGYSIVEQLKGIGIIKLGHCTRILAALGLPII